MTFSFDRIILYVRDVERLATFYQDVFGCARVESIPGEWAVLDAGGCQVALHLAGPAHRATATGDGGNAKLVFSFHGDLAELRADLIARGVPMRRIKSFSGTGPLCDGTDPEGNVFQLAQLASDASRLT